MTCTTYERFISKKYSQEKFTMINSAWTHNQFPIDFRIFIWKRKTIFGTNFIQIEDWIKTLTIQWTLIISSTKILFIETMICSTKWKQTGKVKILPYKKHFPVMSCQHFHRYILYNIEAYAHSLYLHHIYFQSVVHLFISSSNDIQWSVNKQKENLPLIERRSNDNVMKRRKTLIPFLESIIISSTTENKQMNRFFLFLSNEKLFSILL